MKINYPFLSKEKQPMIFTRRVRRIIGDRHPSGIKGEVPALTSDPEREDSNSKMEPSELLSKTLPKIRLTQTVMHSQAN